MRRSSDIRKAKHEFPAFLAGLRVTPKPLISAITQFCDEHGVEPTIVVDLIPADMKAALKVEAVTYQKPTERRAALGHERPDLDETESMFEREALRVALPRDMVVLG